MLWKVNNPLPKHLGWVVDLPETVPLLSTHISILTDLQSHGCLPLWFSSCCSLPTHFACLFTSSSSLPMKLYPLFKFHFFHEALPHQILRYSLPLPSPPHTPTALIATPTFSVLLYTIKCLWLSLRSGIMFYMFMYLHITLHKGQFYRCPKNICFGSSRYIWSIELYISDHCNDHYTIDHCVICICSRVLLALFPLWEMKPMPQVFKWGLKYFAVSRHSTEISYL